MATCYLCGRTSGKAPSIRRKVRTGEWLRRAYGTGKPQSRTAKFGMRVVCANCRRELDRQARIAEILQYKWEMTMAGALLLGLLLLRFFG